MTNFTYLFAVPAISYQESLDHIIKLVVGVDSRMCYVTLNKTNGIVESMLKNLNVLPTNIHFVDGISGSFKKVKNEERVTYLTHPLRIPELYRVINHTVQEKKLTVVVFDSISNLTAYSNTKEIIRFFNTLTAKLREEKVLTIFICLLSDLEKEIMSHVSMFVDRVEKITDIK